MEHPGFFDRAGPYALRVIAGATGSVAAPGSDESLELWDVRPLKEAGPGHATFVDNRKYVTQLAGTRAGACFVAPMFAARVPPGTVALVTKAPYRAFALSLKLFYPDSHWSKVAGTGGEPVDPTAALEDGVVVEPM